MAGLVCRRAELGLSQAQVARLMGTSQSVVAGLESGRHDPRLSTLTRYAAAVGASLRFSEFTQASRDVVPLPARQPKPQPDHVLTWRQRKVLQVIRESVQKRGYPPTLREIGDAVGLASTSSVAYQIRALENKGCLRKEAGYRAIVLAGGTR